MNLLSERRELPWLPPGGVVRLFQSATLPVLDLTTSAYAMIFQGENLLFINDKERGWDIPGGHKEQGEDLVQTVTRELHEEAAARAKELVPFATVVVEVPGTPPAGYTYPTPQSFMAFFIGRLERLDPFAAEYETVDRKFFTPAEALELAWVKNHLELYGSALDYARRVQSKL